MKTFFTSKDHPKSPNTRILETKRFDISGTDIQISIPKGNFRQIPSPEGNFLDRIDIYSPPGKNTYELDLETMISIGDRIYDFTGFLGVNIGSMRLNINAHRVHNKDINIFFTKHFREHLNDFLLSRCSAFNEKIDEDWLKLKLLKDFTMQNINGASFTKYTMIKQGKPNYHYATPIFDDGYLEIIFDYSNVRNENDPWLKKAHAIQEEIIDSIHIKLTESAATAKTSAK